LSKQRALLFANGKLADTQWLETFIVDTDYLIAVDGGLNHLEAIGVLPHLLIGDLDSVTPEQVEYAQAKGVNVEQYPVAKDETDLELALLAAQKHGANEIVVIAALGGRLDQTLGNLSLFLHPSLSNCSVRFEDGSEEVFVVRSSAKIEGKVGEIVSLIPLWGRVEGVTTENLAYPLHGETLYPDHTRGISNVLTISPARVSLSTGMLLCIHTHQNQVSRRSE